MKSEIELPTAAELISLEDERGNAAEAEHTVRIDTGRTHELRDAIETEYYSAATRLVRVTSSSLGSTGLGTNLS